jgi:hypothetical protein
MTAQTKYDLMVQSYFEARTNIRELEMRQFNTIQFFLGAFAAVLGGSIGLMEYAKDSRHLLALSFVFLSNVLSVSLFFLWCSLTFMIHRAALFCIDMVNSIAPDQREVVWETWIRSERNKSSVPYLIESTLLVFLLPLVATLLLTFYFMDGVHPDLLLVCSLTTVLGISLLLLQYLVVLKKVLSTWPKPDSA